MIAITIKVDDREALRVLSRLTFKTGHGAKALERALDEMGLRVQRNAAEKQIIRGGSGPPHPTRLTSRTGTLRRSIRMNRVSVGARDVGTDLLYGLVHELGGRFHPQRPFLAPALEEEVGGFDDILAREIQRLIDG